MAATFIEKAQVAAITATVVSAAWIVAGFSFLDQPADEAPPQEINETVATTTTPDREPQVQPRSIEGKIETPPALASEPSNGAALSIPVQGVSANELSDTFNDQRGGGARVHEAIDIMAPKGTSVIAAAPGRIERLFQSDAGGNTIYVRSQDSKMIYYYAHLDQYADGLNEGEQVKRGQFLGTVGSTGNANIDAPHLHFAVMRTTPAAKWWEPATAVNPYPMLGGR